MKVNTFCFGAVVVTIFCCFQTDSVKAQEKTCKAIVGDLTKRQLSGISSCTKSMKFKNSKDKAKKMNCILKCVLLKEGVVKEDGTITPEHVQVFLKKEFPDSLQERANSVFAPCSEKAYGKLDPNPETDEFCKSYDDFIKCLLGGLPTLCT